MITVFSRLLEEMDAGHDTVLVSVVASSGSTPRGAGAHMLVGESGRLCGTIGGGAVEYRAEQLAAEALQQHQSRIHDFVLRRNEIEDLGMVCGGDVTVFFRYIAHDDRTVHSAAIAARSLFEDGEESWLILELNAEADSAVCLYGARRGLCGAQLPDELLQQLGPRPGIIETAGRRFSTETFVRAGRVYIFGGGHVAQALVPALHAVQFRCVVLEDREAFCRKELFPGVEETRLIDLADIGASVSITEADYVCVMTRGHKDDMLVQAFAMHTPARYIGVIGSRKKIAAVTARIKQDYGFKDEDFSRITTPIGLDIGAQTPAEIAVSITAQLIAVRAGRTPSGEKIVSSEN